MWFDDPSREHAADQAGDDVVLIKDREGRVIGFERLNVEPSTPGSLKVELAGA